MSVQERLKWIVSALVFGLSLVLAPASAHAAVNIFVRIDGINGESRDARHANWIDASSYAEGVSTSLSTSIGSGAGAGKPQFANLQITKALDSASVLLSKTAAMGKHLQTVQIDFVKAGGGGKELVYFSIVLKDVFIASVTRQGTESGTPTEIVSFAASSYQWTYVPQKADGSGGAAITGGYDLKSGKVL